MKNSLTHRDHITVVLHHDIPIQSPLFNVEAVPLIWREINCNILERQDSLSWKKTDYEVPRYKFLYLDKEYTSSSQNMMCSGLAFIRQTYSKIQSINKNLCAWNIKPCRTKLSCRSTGWNGICEWEPNYHHLQFQLRLHQLRASILNTNSFFRNHKLKRHEL